MTSFHPDDAQQDENENVRPARAVRSTTRILDSEKLVEPMRGLPRTSPHGGQAVQAEPLTLTHHRVVSLRG